MCTCSLFFFQAEDGIRDGHVTGVQTCALPILVEVWDLIVNGRMHQLHAIDDEIPHLDQTWVVPVRTCQWRRSEERRVGKRVGLGGRGGRERKRQKWRRTEREYEERCYSRKASL